MWSAWKAGPYWLAEAMEVKTKSECVIGVIFDRTLMDIV